MNQKPKKIDIKSLSKYELINWLKNIGEKKFKAIQIFKWIYQKQCDNFDNMTDLSKNLKKHLKKNFNIKRLSIKSTKISSDGTRKYTFELSDLNKINALLIPEEKHRTICISSQVGCAQKCKFCLTGQMGLIRNLNSNEIINQIRDIQNLTKNKKYSFNIVFMGMGEPLANYKELIKTLKIISNGEYGLKISQRRITISTAGIIPKIKLLGLESKANLAISLNASNNKIRNNIMPINKIFTIEKLIEACNNFPMQKRKKITFEYVMLKGINDSIKDAKNLTKLLDKSRSKINLIPFNEYPGCKFSNSSKTNIKKFQNYLINKNYTTMLRNSKGKDILGACGQLKTNL